MLQALELALLSLLSVPVPLGDLSEGVAQFNGQVRLELVIPVGILLELVLEHLLLLRSLVLSARLLPDLFMLQLQQLLSPANVFEYFFFKFRRLVRVVSGKVRLGGVALLALFLTRICYFCACCFRLGHEYILWSNHGRRSQGFKRVADI